MGDCHIWGGHMTDAQRYLQAYDDQFRTKSEASMALRVTQLALLASASTPAGVASSG